MFRYPDKPYQRPQTALKDLDRTSDYIATYKYDGWRCLIDISEDVRFLSRYNKSLPVCKDLKDQVIALKLPKGTILDTEWMSRRPGYIGSELLYLITILKIDGEWLTNKTEIKRWKLCNEIRQTPNILIPESSTGNYSLLFEKSKTANMTEGIVLKHVNGTLICDQNSSKKNGMWIKIKWREGDDGQFIR
jgi:ATP-dependent DNA ligase